MNIEAIVHNYFAVSRKRGPAWDASLPSEQQPLFREHARFMNGLAADGFAILGGPLGDGEEVLLLVDSESEEAVRSRLALDPWSEAGLLEVASVDSWSIRLEAPFIRLP